MHDVEREQKYARQRRTFYEALESQVKRYQPDYFGPAMVACMRHLQANDRFALAPPHRIAMAIEANCAWARGAYTETLTRLRYAKINNTFSRFDDPAMLDLIERDFGSFLFLQREQMELQRGCARDNISRPRLLKGVRWRCRSAAMAGPVTNRIGGGSASPAGSESSCS